MSLLANKQWGSSYCGKDQIVSFTYPLSLTLLLSALESRDPQTTSSMDYCSDIYEVTKTAISIKSGGGIATMIYWLVIGMQQWGLRLQSASTFVVAYPIAFSTQCYCVCLGNINEHTGTVVAHVANNTKVTQTQVEFASNHKNYYASNYWIALGCQQWGYKSSYTDASTYTMTLPIAFSTSVYFADVSADNIGWADTPSYKVAPTLTQITVILQVHTNPNLRIFCIGYQQWGRGMAGTYNSLKTVTLPVAYSNQNYSLVASVGHASSDSGNYTRTVYMSSISTTSFKWASCFNQNNPTSFECGWITVGIQQWGSFLPLALIVSQSLFQPFMASLTLVLQEHMMIMHINSRT